MRQRRGTRARSIQGDGFGHEGARELFTSPDEIVTLPSGETKRLGDCSKEDIAQLIKMLEDARQSLQPKEDA